MKNIRKLFLVLILCGLLISICAAYSAIPEDLVAPASIVYHGFYLNLEHGGTLDLATARTKELDANYATYHLTTILNNTGFPLYINIRNENGSTRVGEAKTIYSGTSTPTSIMVYYSDGYGNVGTKYRPSAQTSSSATTGAYIEGQWRP